MTTSDKKKVDVNALIEALHIEIGGDNSTLFAMDPLSGVFRHIEFGDTEVIMNTCRSFNELSEETRSPWLFFYIPGYHTTESVEAKELKGRYDFFFANSLVPFLDEDDV